jgi:FKBP-type peptidyl-prolyl cis-trans isomerase FkpA
MTSVRRAVRRSLVLAALAAAIGAAACSGGSPVSPVSVAFSQTDLRVGTGVDALSGKTVTVNYTGWIYDSTKTDKKGSQFDSSIGRTPLIFVLGTAQVIEGFDRGITGMKVGGTRRIIIPPSLGFGGVANGPIPANSTLVFEVDLLDVQ